MFHSITTVRYPMRTVGFLVSASKSFNGSKTQKESLVQTTN